MLMRSRAKPEVLTGVAATLTADHRSRDGKIHGHTWEITLWRSYDGHDAATLRWALENLLAPYQGTCLPDRIAWAEPMACWIAEEFEHSVCRVTIERRAERLFAEWRAA